jgi:hypothetical protein
MSRREAFRQWDATLSPTFRLPFLNINIFIGAFLSLRLRAIRVDDLQVIASEPFLLYQWQVVEHAPNDSLQSAHLRREIG